MEPVASSGKSGPRGDAGEFVRTVWYDGSDERVAWLDPELVADHSPSAASRAALLALAPSAQELSAKDSTVRIWSLPTGSAGSVALCEALRSAAGGGVFSPVFHTNPARESPRSSLPGGVVVAFDAEWTSAAAEAALAERGLSIARRLELGTSAYVVSSAPGLAAIELANELRVAAGVRWASPDWWTQPQER